jgi:PhoH-like ATPase
MEYTGFRQLDVQQQLIDTIYEKGQLEVWNSRLALHPNLYLELKSSANEKNTVLARVDSTGKIVKRLSSIEVSGIKPRNREQVFALDALMNDEITVVALTGPAGTGKSLLALAAAFSKIQDKTYDKVILTKPMSEVGKYKLGSLPGGIDEKFNPYLLNYMTNLECFVSPKYAKDMLNQNKFEMVPIQLMRGASFHNCLVLADEVQVLDYMEILTIGTRIAEGSKIVLMGDLQQRDSNITKEKTGLYKLSQDKRARESSLMVALELQQCERSPTARFFAQIFNE